MLLAGKRLDNPTQSDDYILLCLDWAAQTGRAATGRAGRYLAATRSFDNAETGLGSEIVMRVPQTEQ